MKISYRTNPIFEKIEKQSLGKLAIDEKDVREINVLSSHFQDVWKKYSKSFSENMDVLTLPFCDAIERSRQKLADPELIKKTPSKSGTIVFGENTICYHFNNSKDDDFNFVLYWFSGQVLTFFNYYIETHLTWVSKSVLSKEIYDADISKTAMDLTSTLILILNFIKYAPIEVKFLGAGKRAKDISCKYANDTKSNINILDSTWFTTLVKSEGFKVRGHFRLQPCGEGMKDRKLIWINDFEKEGYTRHFKRPVTLEEFEI